MIDDGFDNNLGLVEVGESKLNGGTTAKTGRREYYSGVVIDRSEAYHLVIYLALQLQTLQTHLHSHLK